MKLSEQNFKEWIMGMLSQHYPEISPFDRPDMVEKAKKLKQVASDIITFAKEQKIFEP